LQRDRLPDLTVDPEPAAASHHLLRRHASMLHRLRRAEQAEYSARRG
jgi:hypothetical protein